MAEHRVDSTIGAGVVQRQLEDMARENGELRAERDRLKALLADPAVFRRACELRDERDAALAERDRLRAVVRGAFATLRRWPVTMAFVLNEPAIVALEEEAAK